ncbi:MBL fold metallo-hydrolase [Deinococcus detaillensis]|uniref:MBL fold metallo-hydrolase n=1 Tax=Deinococcus detaillensis TaxID=2592048 RepID=A0A553UJY6_9DEIO|nr:MBL fold metallo-hydrolase [Deinococcus detaillensis]TSA80527.1 MBL fold metallo-hydrolase [Deinococcus detaillensis]
MSFVLPPPQRHALADGTLIYSFPVRVFGDFLANIYVVRRGDYTALIDTGSGTDQSNADLLTGFSALSDLDAHITWTGLSRIVITHGHIDHHGGLDFVRTLTQAPVAVHELDQPVLSAYRERIVLTSRALRAFLHGAGVDEAGVTAFMKMYGAGKIRFVGGPVDTELHHGDLLDGLFKVIHTPGHCPGQVCLRVGEVLLSADQVLAHTTPHLSAESITPGNGLSHYLHSLDLLDAEEGIVLTLAGHEEPISDLRARTADIRASHTRKMKRILSICTTPSSLQAITSQLYPRVKSYDTLLALEKVGALVEYLSARGEVRVANLEQMERDEEAAPLYQTA